jgi:undecaprenyl diphosphate synthase
LTIEQNDNAPAPPRHVAITMDGNGRWASARGLPRAEGHRRGADAALRIVKAAAKLGVEFLTLYSFSSENWSRPADEVHDLMGLLRWRLRSEVAEMHKQGVCLRVIGDRDRLPSDIVALVEKAEELTAKNTRITVIMALSYGGRSDIVAAARRLVTDGVAADEIDEAALQSRLSTAGAPDPDLFIRTGGEQRISNFLLWESAYAEFLFTDAMWPEFDEAHLTDAITAYHGRERRYGGLRAG